MKCLEVQEKNLELPSASTHNLPSKWLPLDKGRKQISVISYFGRRKCYKHSQDISDFYEKAALNVSTLTR